MTNSEPLSILRAIVSNTLKDLRRNRYPVWLVLSRPLDLYEMNSTWAGWTYELINIDGAEIPTLRIDDTTVEQTTNRASSLAAQVQSIEADGAKLQADAGRLYEQRTAELNSVSFAMDPSDRLPPRG